MHLNRPSWRGILLRCIAALLLILLPACSAKVKMGGDPAPPQVIVEDLVVAQLDWLDNVVAQGESIPIAVAISGTGISVRDVACNIYISTSPSVSLSSTLAASLVVPSGSYLNYYSWNASIATSALQLAPGTYYVACVVDPQNQRYETNEGNNFRQTVSGCQVTSASAADLADGGSAYWSISPSVISQPGVVVNVGLRIINGTSVPCGGFVVRVYASLDATISSASDVLVGDFSVSGLSACGFQDLQRSIATSGLALGQSYYIGWIIDALGAVVEASESNNVAVITPTRLSLGAGSLPDLTVNSGGASFSPSSVPVGGALSTSCPVSNIGVAPSGSYSVSFFASVDTSITTSDVLLGTVGMSTLLPGSAILCSITNGSTSSLQAGAAYWIGWVIDPASVVSESNEANNSGYVSGAQLFVSGSNPSSYTVTPISNGFSPQGGTLIFDGVFGPYDDYYSTLSGLPIPIRFYGQSYSAMQVHTNGFITFGTTVLNGPQARDNTPLPSSGLPNSVIAPFWDDLLVDTLADVSYSITGTEPSRVMTIDFINLTDWATQTARVSSQVRIYEAVGSLNSRIEIVYGLSANWGSVIRCTVGIENASGSSAVTPVAGSPDISSRPSTGFRFQ